jgi:molybdopterin/thiamine biosynthesis adenylyltransferase/proteasome lid subunit RPN8/RPN11
MIELVLAAEESARLQARLIGGDTERCAIIYATQVSRADGTTRLLTREVQFAEDADYTRRGHLEAELKPEVVAWAAKRAKRENLALVFVHSHPGSDPPFFSSLDSRGEKHLEEFLLKRHPAFAHAAMVVSAGGLRARRLGTEKEIRVISIGSNREVLFDPVLPEPVALEQFDRQIRAFGKAGQEALQRLRVAIVGLGGTGSLISHQLVHLGVRDFILIDPDIVEVTNLNRVANATLSDIGGLKVEVAARYIRNFSKEASVKCVKGDIMMVRTARELLNADLIFACTDSHGSRSILQQVSYQYLIPCIDMGVIITVDKGRISHTYGRVQLLAPGLACLTCGDLLDPNEVRRDMLSEFERQADPYIQGVREPAPAVMSLNGTVSSLAVTMFLAVTIGIPMKGRHLLYNAMLPSLRSARGEAKTDCYVCSRSGSYARGDGWPLFARES